MLPGRPDLNRCFRPPWEGDEGEVAGEALRLLREANPEALLDLHNNTGRNPPYAVVTGLDAARLNLAGLFGERTVVTDIRLGSLVEATSDDFPTLTIECGYAGDPAADEVAFHGLTRYFRLDRLETRRVIVPRMSVLEQPIRVQILPGRRLAFATAPVAGADLTLAGDIDQHNFQPLLPGVPVGWLGAGADWPLEARDAAGNELSHDLFVEQDAQLVTRRGLIPIMMTTDPLVAASDCLFYVVQQREEIGSNLA
jgi:hypothetical protein